MQHAVTLINMHDLTSRNTTEHHIAPNNIM